MGDTDYMFEAEVEAGKLRDKDFTGTSRTWKMIALPLIYALLAIAQALQKEKE